jgi:eukaryotic-like serine/threonine-protein kinase
MIVSFSGVTKVAGYGALNVAPREMGGQRVKGRRLHCAPEQVLGGRDAINRQTDVYLLGLTLYELLVGVVPFEFELDFDQAVLSKPLPNIENPDVPAALKEVIARATAKKAGDRYLTAMAFKEAVEKAVGGLVPLDELSGYLREYFPPGEEKRSARRRAIDEGIADFARGQWDLEKSASRPAITLPAVVEAPPPKVVAPAAPAKRPAPPPPRARLSEPIRDEPEEDSQSERAPPRKSKGGVIAVSLFAGLAVIAGLVFALGGSRKEAPVAPPPIVEAPPVVDAGVAEASPPDAGVTPSDVVPDEPAPLPPKPAEVPPSLELQVEPSVDLSIDGTPVGRAPFSGPMAPGRHTVQLVDKAKGISTTRVVNVKSRGVTQERIFLSKGFVSISAPDGAQIFIDGKLMGTAPLKELSVYEGNHRILVMVGKAKWQQAFSVRGSERMYFNVETE